MGRIQRSAEEHAVRTQVTTPRHSTGTGFVHTVEPGIYFIPELIDMWRAEKKFTDFINYDKVETYKDFGGIRNEEDYLITETGARRLGKKIPLTPEEVEALR